MNFPIESLKLKLSEISGTLIWHDTEVDEVCFRFGFKSYTYYQGDFKGNYVAIACRSRC